MKGYKFWVTVKTLYIYKHNDISQQDYLLGNSNVSFGYNFNYANFANVGITRTWQIFKNDYDVRQAISTSPLPENKKEIVRNQKLSLNIFANISQYLLINAVMLKLDKQVNRNTLIAVSVPFLINLGVDIFSRTQAYQTLKNRFFPGQEKNQTSIKYEQYPSDIQKTNQSHPKDNVSFGVSYTTVHLLGKLVNKIRAAGFQTYDVYSASKQTGLSNSGIFEATTKKFLLEMSSQLLENIFYFAVLLKFKKRIDKSLKMAIFLPALLTIGIDILNRSKAFNFLNKAVSKLSASQYKTSPALSLKRTNIKPFIVKNTEFENYIRKVNAASNHKY